MTAFAMRTVSAAAAFFNGRNITLSAILLFELMTALFAVRIFPVRFNEFLRHVAAVFAYKFYNRHIILRNLIIFRRIFLRNPAKRRLFSPSLKKQRGADVCRLTAQSRLRRPIYFELPKGMYIEYMTEAIRKITGVSGDECAVRTCFFES